MRVGRGSVKLLSFLLPTTSECRNREAPGDFAAGAGGTVASSRAAISSLVSFPLGLDRPSSELQAGLRPGWGRVRVPGREFRGTCGPERSGPGRRGL